MESAGRDRDSAESGGRLLGRMLLLELLTERLGLLRDARVDAHDASPLAQHLALENRAPVRSLYGLFRGALAAHIECLVDASRLRCPIMFTPTRYDLS